MRSYFPLWGRLINAIRGMPTRAITVLVTVVAAAATTALAAGASMLTASPATATETVPPGGGGLTIMLRNNNTAYSNDQVFVHATGSGLSAPQLPLSQRSSFKLGSVSSGRVWVPLGKQLDTTTPPSPDNSDARFDVVELTYPGVANLTSVDMLGIPMDIETFDVNGSLVATKKWRCYTDVVAQSLQTKLNAAGISSP